MFRAVLSILSAAFFLSCDRATPAGIWDKFETNLRIEKQSDQGPWGGTRAYYWKSDQSGYFNTNRIIGVAYDKDWELVDSVKYKAEDLERITSNNQLKLRINVGPFEPSSDTNFIEHEFPRWTTSDLTLYKFKSGWMIFYPGTDHATEINGFIALSADRREMTVYHLWGE